MGIVAWHKLSSSSLSHYCISFVSMSILCAYKLCGCLMALEARTSDSLELEFQTAVSSHLGAGN